jgi:hypothetical protein
MRHFVVCLVAIIAFLAPTHSLATPYTGQELRRGLRLWEGDFASAEVTDQLEAMAATGYVRGVFDALEGAAFATPAGLQAGTVFAVVLKWLEDHPNTWTQQANLLVMAALNDAWGTDEQRAQLRGMREYIGAGE